MDFWEQKSNMKNKPTLKNKTIITLEYISKKYNLAMGIVLEKIFNKEIDYKKEYEDFKKEGVYGL